MLSNISFPILLLFRCHVRFTFVVSHCLDFDGVDRSGNGYTPTELRTENQYHGTQSIFVRLFSTFHRTIFHLGIFADGQQNVFARVRNSGRNN